MTVDHVFRPFYSTNHSNGPKRVPDQCGWLGTGRCPLKPHEHPTVLPPRRKTTP